MVSASDEDISFGAPCPMCCLQLSKRPLTVEVAVSYVVEVVTFEQNFLHLPTSEAASTQDTKKKFDYFIYTGQDFFLSSFCRISL